MHDPLSVHYAASLSPAASLKPSPQAQAPVLGALCFAAEAAAGPGNDAALPCARVPLPRLDGGDAVWEVWHGNGPLTHGHRGAIRYCNDDAVMFGVITMSEAPFAAVPGKTPLQRAAEAAYREVFALLDTLGFTYLYRFWNYLPHINAHSHGLERYRQFNLGRHDAFAQLCTAARHNGAAQAPAACALGTAQGPMTIAFLAGHIAPQRIENPRQVSAYHYPQQYGARSPLFSRATRVSLPRQELLLISGTASVVGHATMHVGDAAAQARETITNVESVLAEANRLSRGPKFGWRDLACRVYVRRRDDLARIRAVLEEAVGDALHAAYLQADICRDDLLLEIEASAVLAHSGGVRG